MASIGFSVRTRPLPPLHERWEIWVISFSLIGTALAVWATAKKSDNVYNLKQECVSIRTELSRLQKLEEEIQQKYDDLCSLHLEGVAQRMGLGPNDRVSIYKHDGNAFYRIARHCKCPAYAKGGRSVYPDNQGCVGAAWNDGKAFDENLPAKHEPYREKLRTKWGIKPEVVDSFTMKARSIAAFALNRSVGGKRFAVIVFESVSPTGISTKHRERFSQECDGVIQWLETMERFEPKPIDASREGF